MHLSGAMTNTFTISHVVLEEEEDKFEEGTTVILDTTLDEVDRCESPYNDMGSV